MSDGVKPSLSVTEQRLIRNTVASQSRSALLALLDPRRSIERECGYPEGPIQIGEYRVMYEREMGVRVVSIYPEETWRKMPSILEDEDPNVETDFEVSLDEVEQRHGLLHYMHRVDELSGIGRFGVLLWGLDDGKDLSSPVEGWQGWSENGGAGKGGAKRKLLFIRALDESLVTVATWEINASSPRYGLPLTYNITLNDPSAASSAPSLSQTSVHWTRITHIADNRRTSEVYGAPRMEAVWNRLLDLRKILGGNGEMFWRGGFPGISLETQPGLEHGELDVEATKATMEEYMNGLQRYVATAGMTARSLAPQVADPKSSFDTQVKAICITLGVPYRVFMGIEEGVVSGDQATKAWAARLANRQSRYVTPMIINPIIQRLVDVGVVAPPKNHRGWRVEWPPMLEESELEKADVALKRTDALSKYVAGAVDALIPPMEYLTIICGINDDQAESVIAAATEHAGSNSGDPEPEPGPKAE